MKKTKIICHSVLGGNQVASPAQPATHSTRFIALLPGNFGYLECEKIIFKSRKLAT